MPRIIPSYRQRKGYDQAIVTLRDAVTRKARDYWLGEYDTPQSRELYHRIIADWEANGRRLIDPPKVESAVPQELTVVELCRQYWDWAVGHFGQQDASNLKLMLRVLVQMCGSSTAAGFGPNKLRQVREAMIQGDPAAKPPRRPWSRKYVNVQVQRIVRIFKWAASRELLPVTVYQQLRTIEPLRRGRCSARETEPVRPVADELVDAIRPHVSRQVWALIELQRWSGARPCELFRLRPVDLHMEEEKVWTYSPDEHKTAYRGRKRTIYIGPRAQEAIQPFLAGRAVDVPLFSPAEAEAERRVAMHEKRVTPLSCGNTPGSNRKQKPHKTPGTQYTTASYSKAILFACDKAFALPPELARKRVHDHKKRTTRREMIPEWQRRLGPARWAKVLAWQKGHRWHPYQLRHSAATKIRRQFGLEAAQIALGHSSALVTEAVYAERDMSKAVEVMRTFG